VYTFILYFPVQQIKIKDNIAWRLKNVISILIIIDKVYKKQK